MTIKNKRKYLKIEDIQSVINYSYRCNHCKYKNIIKEETVGDIYDFLSEIENIIERKSPFTCEKCNKDVLITDINKNDIC